MMGLQIVKMKTSCTVFNSSTSKQPQVFLTANNIYIYKYAVIMIADMFWSHCFWKDTTVDNFSSPYQTVFPQMLINHISLNLNANNTHLLDPYKYSNCAGTQRDFSFCLLFHLKTNKQNPRNLCFVFLMPSLSLLKK